jgi:4-hydroxythreonine-4-phosphate dehydrogenase
LTPRIALALGDPTGIGPELVAKLLAQPGVHDAADVQVIGSGGELLRAQRLAGVEEDAAQVVHDVPLEGAPLPHGEVSAEAGRHCLDTLAVGLDLVAEGGADALCFAPLNKAALRAGGNPYGDELHWFAERLGFEGYVGEINVVEELWTARATSHIALREVADRLTPEAIVDAIELIDGAMREAGFAEPRIALCCLNPHCSDGGAFGDEEREVIEPAVRAARERLAHVLGPYPADTIFMRARDEGFDAIVTMYHDQGQIALKLLGVDGGVTLQGGLPVPITTPAHGTAFDIAGQGVAKPSAMRRAFDLACRMGERRSGKVA